MTSVLLVAVLLLLIHRIDGRTGSAPFQHLYYMPIVIAGVMLPPYGGVLAAVAAVLLYHLANPALLTFAYRESDVVQIALFLAIGLVTAKLASDGRRLRAVAETDDLTGLYNLRGFERQLVIAVADAIQRAQPLAMLVLDVDRLKALNDVHGHRAGSDAVRTVGGLIADCLPADAFACRFGGDEFVVALPGSTVARATMVADAIREAVHAAAPTLADLAFPPGTLSVSIGAATLRPGESAVTDFEQAGEALFRRADGALYAAKNAGRNQTKPAVRRG